MKGGTERRRFLHLRSACELQDDLASALPWWRVRYEDAPLERVVNAPYDPQDVLPL